MPSLMWLAVLTTRVRTVPSAAAKGTVADQGWWPPGLASFCHSAASATLSKGHSGRYRKATSTAGGGAADGAAGGCAAGGGAGAAAVVPPGRVPTNTITVAASTAASPTHHRLRTLRITGSISSTSMSLSRRATTQTGGHARDRPFGGT